MTISNLKLPSEMRLGKIIDYVSFSVKAMPLSLLLDETPRKIAAIIDADVASIYLLEGDGESLVMRGNIGFPKDVRGLVRLRVGEGITGMAVECLRPIAVEKASEHDHYRAFPSLKEERYPVFVAVPILGQSRALGALVVQRAGSTPFQPEEIQLLMALTAPIAAAIRHAEVLDDLREKRGVNQRTAGGGTRKITLTGIPVIAGQNVGAIAPFRRPALRAKKGSSKEDTKCMHDAFELAEKVLSEIYTRAKKGPFSQDAEFLANYLLIVNDARLQERAMELIKDGSGVGEAMSVTAREVARAANSAVGSSFLRERAKDIEDLCDALSMLANPDARAELPSKAVLIGSELTVFDLIVSIRSKPVAIALSEKPGPRAQVLLHLLGIPAIANVHGVYKWAAPGDIALVDADHGLFVINPSRSEVARVRATRNQPA